MARGFRSTLNRIVTIWRGTYLRAFRDRSLVVVSCFCAFLVAALLLVRIDPDSVHSYITFGVFSSIAPGVIISIFIGNYTVSAEIEDRTLSILFSKPVTPYEAARLLAAPPVWEHARIA